MQSSLLKKERERLLTGLGGIIGIDRNGVPTIADKDLQVSVDLAKRVLDYLGLTARIERAPGQSAGSTFESAVALFVQSTFPEMQSIRPGRFEVVKGNLRNSIADYSQYEHLTEVDAAVAQSEVLRLALGRDYMISPDIIVFRHPELDSAINARQSIVDATVARQAAIRSFNGVKPVMHASISCKWTMRSDRAQNARSEALNMIRNRKGHLPHITIVTAEPLPSRLASLAMGTGDIDCVYHIALDALLVAVRESGRDDSEELLRMLVDGKRLKDITDLPLDLAV